VPTGDINCRDCDVRLLAEPEPNRQVFVKFSTFVEEGRRAPAETICVMIGEIPEHLRPPNAPTISETHAVPNPKSIML
jgi:hypothetical protein